MILHLTRKEKFTKPFITFVRENFASSEHFFLLVGGQKNHQFDVTEDEYLKVISNKKDFLKFFINFNIKMYKADKIIIHGLSQPYVIYYLFLNPWLLKKTYWVMWGGDFYFPEKQSWIKKQVIKKMGYCVTLMPQEFEYVKKHYACKDSQYYKSTSFMYLSNIYQESEINLERDHNEINIQIGNSASSENMHFEVFEKLKKYKNENIKIYAPLSYGDKEYAKRVILKGKEIFGDKFEPLLELMPLEKYKNWMKNIDIGIFYNNRQQGVGNITTLLGFGKKVYLRNKVSTFLYFKELGFKIYDFNDFNLDLMSIEDSKHNIKLMQENFSIERYKKNLEKLFRN
jgi:hypothetical protein